MNALRTALGFLTILPVARREPGDPASLGRAAGWFPFVGALIGFLVALAQYALLQVLSPLPAAVLAAAAWIILSGGLHLDGLADCCDGMLNAASRERRLEIMKDPHLGTFGGIGLILAILLKVALLASLPPAHLWVALPLAATTARWLLLPASTRATARPGGLGAAFSRNIPSSAWLPAALIPALLTLAAGWRGLAGLLAAHLVAWVLFQAARSRLGGLTGDVLGSTVELAELVVLTAFCVQV